MTGKPRILFVDDEKRVLNAMRGLFRRHYELFLANSGAEAIEIVSTNDIDVIVCDQRMPGMNGIEVLAFIKQKSPRTVRILLTGYADPGAIEGSINVGEVFRFLSKPCPPNVLRETLTLAVEASRTVSAPPAPTAEPEPAPKADPKPAPPPPAAPPRVELAAPTFPPPGYDVEDEDDEDAVVDLAPTPEESDDTLPSIATLTEDQLPADRPSPHWGTVNNVVLSGDTVEEQCLDSTGQTAMPGRREVGIVVFTIDSEFASTAIRAVSTERTVIVATTLVKVAEAIRNERAGVLVTDFTTNKAILQKIVTALKLKLPELVTITVADGRDSTDMIHLINYGQVFRYLIKPIESDQLRAAINAAVVHHLYLLDNPDAVKRHQVVDQPKSTTTLEKYFGTGDSLRRRWNDEDDTTPDESAVKR